MKKKFFLLTALCVCVFLNAQNISNCYNIGALSASMGQNVGGIAGLMSSSGFVVNETSLYLNTLSVTNAYGTAKSSADLKNAVSILNGVQDNTPWVSDSTSSINNGYPVLSWQKGIVSNDIHHVADQDVKLFYLSLANEIQVQDAKGYELQIFNLLGTCCFSDKITEDYFSLSINNFAKGGYIVRIQKSDFSFSIKIIK